ncbi:hypothetical protein K504DRAFT_529291 [Pleomassaria siparia CBS 279.74]|uniref:F-box domain-containing protein n=1 Tax=Pleomassaria siparia CBS 279.74 TaxID=1314801 RepID=A0A6G1KQG9_9PLEO|nr:hypothetical protein K504DRAFT_529291 [Pleomassaria siparia CBS 279.74]
MADTLSLPLLSLNNLPNTRMSVDFSTFASDLSNLSAPQSNARRAKVTRHHLHHVDQHRTAPGPLLPEVQEEPAEEPTNSATPSRQNSLRWPWRKSDQGRVNGPPVATLARTNSTTSVASNVSTSVSSVFSHAQLTSTRTSSSSTLYSVSSYSPKEVNRLSTLPLSLLEHIMSYTLSLPLQVSIGPEDSETRHLSHRYHRSGLDYVDLRQALKHPLFLVSRNIRDVALDVFHRKCDFVIDLHKIYHTQVSSTINANIKKHQKFWLSDTPKGVKESLRRLSKLHLRLPVPSTEAGVHRDRGEDDWMDGSDGKGGGGWKVKSMKREQEDALDIQKCIDAIKELVMTDPKTEILPLTRSRSAVSVRRNESVKVTRSQSADLVDPRMKPRVGAYENGETRTTLKRLEIVFVKRSPWALVLPESLGPVRTFRSVPVSGYTKYHFELNGQRFVWATKHRKKWQGMEPDGNRLLNDLQQLTVVEPPIEPIQTPVKFKFVNVDRQGQLRLLDTALPKTPIVLEAPPIPEKELPSIPSPDKTSAILKALPWSKRKPRERKDSFSLMMEQGITEIGTGGSKISGKKMKAPTVDELKQIAEDIKNGLY